MLDDRDALLVREFAKSQRPLADAQFVAQLRERLPPYSGHRLLGVVLAGVVRAISTGLSFGLIAPLRMRHAGLAALAALGIVLWNLVSRSL